MRGRSRAAFHQRLKIRDMKRVKTFVTLLRDAARAWWNDDVPRLAAAVAFFTLFSFAPLVIVTIVIAGAVFGEEAAAGQLVHRLEGLVGLGAGNVIQDVLANAHHADAGVFATLLTVLISLFAATGMFHELRKALDLVWERAPEPTTGLKQGALELARGRLRALAMVLGIGLFLLFSLLASTILSGVSRVVPPVFWSDWLWLGRVVDIVISLGFGTVAFALIYKFLPASRIAWRDAWRGAFVGALLFSFGRVLIGVYLANSAFTSVYGAAGALVVVIVWAWCSAMILLFGAEFCQVYAEHEGRPIGGTAKAQVQAQENASDGFGEALTSLRGELMNAGTMLQR
jgi:membrane protein